MEKSRLNHQHIPTLSLSHSPTLIVPQYFSRTTREMACRLCPGILYIHLILSQPLCLSDPHASSFPPSYPPGLALLLLGVLGLPGVGDYSTSRLSRKIHGHQGSFRHAVLAIGHMGPSLRNDKTTTLTLEVDCQGTGPGLNLS